MATTTPIYKTIADLTVAAAKKSTDLLEIFQGTKSTKISVKDLLKIDSYDVAVGTTTQLTIDQTVFVVANADTAAKTISLPANLPANRAMTLVVVVKGNKGAVTWDSNIKWSGGVPPSLAATATVGVLLWDGIAVHGSNGASY